MSIEQKIITVGMPIDISRDGGATWCISTVKDIREGIMSITLPYQQSPYIKMPLALSKGDRVQVRVKIDNYCFQLDTWVTDCKDKYYHLPYFRKMRRVDKRKQARLPIALDVKYSYYGCNLIQFKDATTVDLSGGGMKMLVMEEIKANTPLLVVFTLPTNQIPKAILIKARATHCKKIDFYDNIYHVGIKFENITNQIKSQLLRYIYKKIVEKKAKVY
ncbi:flagellar brake protein [Desulfofalx alkaliphila]|uniref:flagellar brake protein n=1 Tax=Desulfofalx alkaliphila TaxID=105483 RepID=UPI0004E124C7|nr:PilZ domain-containing protein [Desulfofalx alkaliphila]